jgi:hypothetical protein
VARGVGTIAAGITAWIGVAMATVRTVERQIRRLEGFGVRIHFSGPGRRRGPDVRSDRRDLPPYDYTRQRTGNVTVASWRKERFERRYPGLTATVVDGRGRDVHPRTLLATVRATYAA